MRITPHAGLAVNGTRGVASPGRPGELDEPEHRTKPPVYACDYSDELDAVDARGHVKVPDGPGLGVPIDWDWVRAHQTDEVVYE